MKKITNKNIKIVKKNLSKIWRKLGYEVIDQNNLTIPSKDKKINEDFSLINNRITNIPLGYIDVEKKINKVLIILRTFTNENKLLSQTKKRIFEKIKKNLSKLYLYLSSYLIILLDLTIYFCATSHQHLKM